MIDALGVNKLKSRNALGHCAVTRNSLESLHSHMSIIFCNFCNSFCVSGEVTESEKKKSESSDN